MWLNIHSDALDRVIEGLAKQFGFEFYGVEAVNVDDDTIVVYANRGDPYIVTVCAVIEKRDVTRIERAAWGDLVEFLKCRGIEGPEYQPEGD